MKKIMIIGCCGSGKSTFARRLHDLTKLELIHLDQHYWTANWVESEPAEWALKVKQLASKSHWIMDGNYGGTYHIRIEQADTIVFLDMPTWKCLWRVITRIIKYHGKVRPDMPTGCKERFSLEFLHYVAVFNLTRKKSILKTLHSFEQKGRVVRLRSDREIDQFFHTLKKSKHERN